MNQPTESINIPAFQRLKSIKAQSKTTKIKISKTPRKKTPKTTFEEITLAPSFITPEIAPLSQTIKQTKTYKTTGSVEGYYEKINVTIIKLTSPLRIGDIILIEQSGGLFQQEISSMQIDRKEVRIARTGSTIGLKTAKSPQIGGKVYKITAS